MGGKHELHEDAGHFFEMVLSQVEDYICVWNTDKQCVYANRKLERLWNIQRDYRGKTPAEIGLSPEGRALFESGISQVLETGAAVTTSFPFGDSRQYDCVFSAVFDDVGQVEYVACVTRDMTERRKVEEALRESERQYELLFRSLEEAFCLLQVVYDHAGEPAEFIVLKVNPAFEKHTGISDAVGRSTKNIVPALEEKWMEAWRRVAKTGEPECFVEESEVLGRWYDTSIYALEGPESSQIVLLFYDITRFVY